MWWVFLSRGLFLFLRAKNKKVPKKSETPKRHETWVQKNLCKKSQKCCMGINIFSCVRRFYVNAIQTTSIDIQNFLFYLPDIFISAISCCCHISFLLFLVLPAPLPTEGFTASFVQTSQRFRTCQNQEGAAYNKKETELPLILNSKCVLSINFRPFANPPLESLLGKAIFEWWAHSPSLFKYVEDCSKLNRNTFLTGIWLSACEDLIYCGLIRFAILVYFKWLIIWFLN